MRNILFVLVGLSLWSCGNTKPGMTKEEFETKIQATEEANIADNRLANGWYATLVDENKFERINKETEDHYFINPKPLILPDNFSKGEEFENNSGSKGFAVYFDQTGINAWSEATGDNEGSYVIFILDNEILTAQMVNSQITNGASAFWKNRLTENQWEKVKAMVKE